MPSPLALDCANVRTVLVGFLRVELERTGLSDAVIGLSGGIDSALVAYLTVEALGPQRTHCVMMPYRTSSADSFEHARLILARLGLAEELVEITPMVDPLLGRMNVLEPVRRGNVMARERMIVLYDVSARERALVIGTGNKTEILLGYSTLHGDSACAINPIGDLYKTQVRELSEYLGVPKEIVRKPPSADLWIGQTDEAEMGVSYGEADEILHALVDERRTPDEVIAAGHDAALVARIIRMVERSQFKRRPPVIAKVSQRTVNVDFRYPRDWKS
jgi:NAD+ synthase